MIIFIINAVFFFFLAKKANRFYYGIYEQDF